MGRVKIDQCGLDKLADFFAACNYAVTDSESYGWECYGNNARIIDAIKWEPHGRDLPGSKIVGAAEIIVDTATHTVFEIAVAEFTSRNGKGSAYKWMNPSYKPAHDREASRKSVPPYQAWDNVNYKLTTTREVMTRIRALFQPPTKKRKPKKKPAPQKKYLQANKRKKTTRRR